MLVAPLYEQDLVLGIDAKAHIDFGKPCVGSTSCDAEWKRHKLVWWSLQGRQSARVGEITCGPLFDRGIFQILLSRYFVGISKMSIVIQLHQFNQ